MTPRSFISNLSVILMFFIMFSCGSDEEPLTRNPIQDFPKSDIIGSWNVTSINDNNPLAFIHTYEPFEVDDDTDGDIISIANPDPADDTDIFEIIIENFKFDFTTDDLWTLNVDFTTTLQIPVEDKLPAEDELPDPTDMGEGAVSPGGSMLDGEVQITGTWSGTYSIIEDSMLSLITNEQDLQVTSVNEGTFENELSTRKVAIRDEYLRKFKTNMLTPFGRAYMTLEEQILTLLVPGGRKTMVLER